MKSIEKRNMVLILALFAFCLMAIYTKVSTENNTDVFIQAVFASAKMSFVIMVSFMLSFYRGFWGLPNYVWLCVVGGALLTFGFGELFFSEEVHAELALLGTAIIVSSLIYPITARQEPLFPDEKQNFKPRRGTEYLQEVLEEKWGVRVRQIELQKLHSHSVSHGINWFIEKFGETEGCILEIFKIDNTSPQKRMIDVIRIYRDLLQNEGEELGNTSQVITSRNSELAENHCPGKFFLSRKGWNITTHAIVFCKTTGILVVYCKPSLANNDKRK